MPFALFPFALSSNFFNVEVIRELINDIVAGIVKDINIQGKGVSGSPESMIWPIVIRLVDESEEMAKKAEVSRTDILMMLRNALDVAAADRRVDECELRTLREFGKRFKFTDSDIVIPKMQSGYC